MKSFERCGNVGPSVCDYCDFRPIWGELRIPCHRLCKWETVWDHKTYSEVKTVQQNQNMVTIENYSPLKTVQRQGKLLTATWLAIPECQVPPTGRGLLGSNRILEFCRVQLTIRAGFVASLWALGVWLFCYTMFKGTWKYLKRISVFENTVNRVFFLCDRRVFIIHWGMQRKKDISIYFLPVACSLAPGYHVSLQREGGILCGGCSWLLEKDKYNQNPRIRFLPVGRDGEWWSWLMSDSWAQSEGRGDDKWVLGKEYRAPGEMANWEHRHHTGRQETLGKDFLPSSDSCPTSGDTCSSKIY